MTQNLLENGIPKNWIVGIVEIVSHRELNRKYPMTAILFFTLLDWEVKRNFTSCLWVGNNQTSVDLCSVCGLPHSDNCLNLKPRRPWKWWETHIHTAISSQTTATIYVLVGGSVCLMEWRVCHMAPLV